MPIGASGAVTRVVDASAVVAALLDRGPAGEWAAEALLGHPLAAPHLMQVEVTNILRRAVLGGRVSAEVGAQALADLMNLRVLLFPFQGYAARVWQLRSTVTSYDAWYVALAERLDADLVTLDQRLAVAPGVGCRFVTP